MKQILAVAIILLSCTNALYAQNKGDKSKGRFYFKEGELHDIGNVKPPRIAMDTFWFENIGNSPIVITFVSTSTAFVAGEWSREAIRPEQRGFVSCIVKTSQHNGPFATDLFIQSNAINNDGESTYRLHVLGNVSKDNAPVKKKKKQAKKKVVVTSPPPAK